MYIKHLESCLVCSKCVLVIISKIIIIIILWAPGVPYRLNERPHKPNLETNGLFQRKLPSNGVPQIQRASVSNQQTLNLHIRRDLEGEVKSCYSAIFSPVLWGVGCLPGMDSWEGVKTGKKYVFKNIYYCQCTIFWLHNGLNLLCFLNLSFELNSISLFLWKKYTFNSRIYDP